MADPEFPWPGLEEQSEGVRQLIVLAMEKNWTEGEGAHVPRAPYIRQCLINDKGSTMTFQNLLIT